MLVALVGHATKPSTAAYRTKASSAPSAKIPGVLPTTLPHNTSTVQNVELAALTRNRAT